ncbi:hypothetical protein LY76DRAFT_630451 [Colletotrichum caudatum]|nr:hypothetical protein LY76DRAFT_630451 [Colletotrichum caudatum]
MSLPGVQLTGPNAEKIRRTWELARKFYEEEDEHHATAVDDVTFKTAFASNKICITKPERVEYLDDYEVKRRLIPEVKDLVAQNLPELNQARFWVLLWSMPGKDVQALRDKLTIDKQQISTDLGTAVESLPRLIHLFRGLPSNKDDGDPTSNDGTHKRNQTESDAAKKRDKYKCVITDTSNAEACHIFPFAGLKYPGKDRVRSLLSKLTDESANTVDTVSNMICLSATLHDWWSKGYFALEPMGEAEYVPSEGIEDITSAKSNITPTKSNITPTKSNTPPTKSNTPPTKSNTTQKSRTTPTKPRNTQKRQSLDRASKRTKMNHEWVIRVRFHWLKNTNVENMITEVDFSDDPVERLQGLEGPGGGLVKAFNATTCRQVEDGQIFTFRSDSEKHLPDYEILLLQWDLLRMWRLAGGADPSMYPLYDDFDAWGTPAFDVRN